MRGGEGTCGGGAGGRGDGRGACRGREWGLEHVDEARDVWAGRGGSWGAIQCGAWAWRT